MRFTYELRKEGKRKIKGQKIRPQNRLSGHQSNNAQTSKWSRHCLVQQGLAHYTSDRAPNFTSPQLNPHGHHLS